MTGRYPIGEYSDPAPTLVPGQFYNLRLTEDGALVVSVGGSGGALVVVGNDTPGDTFANPTDAVPAWALEGFWDGTQWVRARGGQIGAIAQATLAFVQNMIPVARYNNAAIVMVDGTAREIQLTQGGWQRMAEQLVAQAEDNTNGIIAGCFKPLATNTYAPTLGTNFGTATKANLKTSSGNVMAARSSNANGSARYFQLHNKASAPAAGETPLYSFYMPAGSVLDVGQEFFVGSGGAFSTGIGWAISTTAATFTDSATATEHTVHVHFK